MVGSKNISAEWRSEYNYCTLENHSGCLKLSPTSKQGFNRITRLSESHRIFLPTVMKFPTWHLVFRVLTRTRGQGEKRKKLGDFPFLSLRFLLHRSRDRRKYGFVFIFIFSLSIHFILKGKEKLSYLTNNFEETESHN